MPLRPRIIEWEGEFNAFNVLGRTGTGKTSTLELLYQIMGAGENPIGGDQATIFYLYDPPRVLPVISCTSRHVKSALTNVGRYCPAVLVKVSRHRLIRSRGRRPGRR